MAEEPDGFRAPIHRGLVSPLLVAGIPRTLCFLLWTVAAALAFGLQEIWVVPIALGLHAVFLVLTRQDPYFFEVFRNALKAPRRLDP